MEFSYTHQNEIDGSISQSESAGCLLHVIIPMLPHGPKAPRNAWNDLSVMQEMAVTYFSVDLLLMFFGSFLTDAAM